MMKCPHCSATLQEDKDEEKGRYLLNCPKCKCLFSTIIVRNDPKCFLAKKKMELQAEKEGWVKESKEGR